MLVLLLAACAGAGTLAAVALADDGSGGTTTSATTTTGTTTTETTTETTPPAPATLPSGVVVGGVPVGGLAATDAAAALQQAFAAPVVLTYRGTRISIAPDLLGASPAIDRALARAQAAQPDTVVPLAVKVNRARIAAFLGTVAKRFDRKPVDARLLLRNLHPVITPARRGVTVDVRRATSAVAKVLTSTRRAPVPLPVTYARPKVAPASFPSVIVIRRGSNALYLYRQAHLVRVLRVATGQSIYPTPLGRFQIVVKWKNPWWYPPNSPWAQGEKPVPPGPGNPLGTRWMGLSSPGVGIHGTPDAASIGYSASHGCIRMLIPQAEWLFDRVDIGTPVFIVSA
jgi:lipoprotein-anchoring transpeptidase ErfK/SrfK